MQRVLGIDYGTKRVGIAYSDEGGNFALPLAVLINDQHLIEAVVATAQEYDVSVVVLGESKDFNQGDNPIMLEVRAFADSLVRSGFTVVFEPELFTSAAAERLQGKSVTTDASAAALILQSYLDKRRSTDATINS